VVWNQTSAICIAERRLSMNDNVVQGNQRAPKIATVSLFLGIGSLVVLGASVAVGFLVESWCSYCFGIGRNYLRNHGQEKINHRKVTGKTCSYYRIDLWWDILIPHYFLDNCNIFILHSVAWCINRILKITDILAKRCIY